MNHHVSYSGRGKSMPLIAAALLVLALTATPALAGIIQVINTQDLGPGSLRQAIIDANNNPGADEIHFNIPGSGVQTISPATELPVIKDTVTIDGYTQPGASANTLADADNAVLLIQISQVGPATLQYGLSVSADNRVIRGLVIGSFAQPISTPLLPPGILLNSKGNLIEGNFIGTDPTGLSGNGNVYGVLDMSGGNTIGGTTPAARNIISGNPTAAIQPGTGDVIQGNFIGVDATGTVAIPNTFGLYPGGSNNQIGGTVPGARNIISASTYGVALGPNSVTEGNNVIEGNYIGTNATGTAPIPNKYGIILENAPNNRVGGTAPGAGNLISGSEFDGIYVSGLSTGIVIQGNRIGTDAAGLNPLPNNDGIQLVSDASGVLIGGTTAGAGNMIAFNTNQGVWIPSLSGTNFGNNNAILSNSIFSNGALGIDIGPLGVNPIVPCNTTPGPNNLQNYPVLTAAYNSGPVTFISGTLNSKPNAAYTIQFFSNVVADPSSYGQGQVFLGSTTVNTDASCSKLFSVILPVSAPVGRFISATATDANGNTSEFSQDVSVLLNALPMAKCKDVTVIATSGCSADASIDDGSFDPDGDPITLTQTPAGPYPVGDTLVTLTVADDKGGSSQCTATVKVREIVPPVINSVSASPDTLWPANHKMVHVTVTVNATDDCDPSPKSEIVSVTSSEPQGAGDIQITGKLTVDLRAERYSKDGRIYTIYVRCTDASGNSTLGSTTVVVPHNKGKNGK